MAGILVERALISAIGTFVRAPGLWAVTAVRKNLLADVGGCHVPSSLGYLQPATQRQAKGKFMADATKQKFLVLYLIPASVMADWAKTDPTTRQAEEQKMQAAWGNWMGEHAKMIISTEAGGKTKRVTASGVSDTKNDIILCSFVEADSHEAAAKAFENHPHLQIPQSSIEIMYVRPMGGM
jgi:hypothetical protein